MMDEVTTVLSAYRSKDMLCKTARKVCSGFFATARPRSADGWKRTLSHWCDDFLEFENSRGFLPIAEPLLETAGAFLARLAVKLHAAELVSTREERALVQAFATNRVAIVQPVKREAQALLIKALIELSRRRLPPRGLEAVAFPLDKYVRTTDEILSYPLGTPLPRDPRDYDDSIEAPVPQECRSDQLAVVDVLRSRGDESSALQTVLRSRLAWMGPDVAEFHIFVANGHGDYAYRAAVSHVSRFHAALDAAYEFESRTANTTEALQPFVDRYPMYREEVKKRLHRTLLDPSTGHFVPAAWA